MKKLLAFTLVTLCLLTGCTNPIHKDGEEITTESTEVPIPEIIADTSKQVTNTEIAMTFTVFDNTAIGVTLEDSILVYESPTSFNAAYITVAYMPNYQRFVGVAADYYFKDLGDGYVAVINDQGVGADMCNKIGEHISGVTL